MLAIDLRGKRALVAGVGDERGLGFAIARTLANAGASVSVATWPPMLKLLQLFLGRPTSAAACTLDDGSPLVFEAIHPYDAHYDTLADVPPDVRAHRRYADAGDFTTAGLVAAITAAGPLDIVVHSVANAPEIQRPLLTTTRAGYLAAVSASAYSNVALLQQLGPHVRASGSFLALSHLASQRVFPGYGGGMSAAKAALESDARVLAFEAGRRWGHRVNIISAGPYKSRAAEVIESFDRMIEYAQQSSPLMEPLTAHEVAATAAFLSSPLARGITGSVIYVDKGAAAMGTGPVTLPQSV